MRVLALLASAVVAAAAAAQVRDPGLEETLDRLREQMDLYAKPRTRDSRGTTESSYAFTIIDGEDSSVGIWVSLEHFGTNILGTEVNAADGQSLVLGTTSPLTGGGALILVVTPTIEGA